MAKHGGKVLKMFPTGKYGSYREWYNSTDGGEYRRLDESLAFVSEAFEKEQTIDGILGFSQGGNLATSIAVLGERGALPAFSKFAEDGFVVGLSPHRPRDPRVSDVLDGAPLKTRALFVVHADDPVVPASLTRSLPPHFAPGHATLVEAPGAKHSPAQLARGTFPEITAFFEEMRTRKARKGESATAEDFVVRGRLGALVREGREMTSPEVTMLATDTVVQVVETKTIVNNVLRCRLISPVRGWCSRKNLAPKPPS